MSLKTANTLTGRMEEGIFKQVLKFKENVLQRLRTLSAQVSYNVSGRSNVPSGPVLVRSTSQLPLTWLQSLSGAGRRTVWTLSQGPYHHQAEFWEPMFSRCFFILRRLCQIPEVTQTQRARYQTGETSLLFPPSRLPSFSSPLFLCNFMIIPVYEPHIPDMAFM